MDTAKEDTSEDDAASASGGDSTPRGVAGAVTRRRRGEKQRRRDAAEPADSKPAGSVSPVVVGPAVEDVRESVDPVAVSRPANEPDAVAVKPSPSNARRSHPSAMSSRTLSTRRNGEKNFARREKPLFGVPDAASRAEAWRRGFRAWREARGIARSAKVFIVVGSYSDARASLLRRGWVENEDRDSPYFDLKWTTRADGPREPRR